MKKFLFILSCSLITLHLIASEAKPKAAPKQSHTPLKQILENGEPKPFTLEPHIEAAYQRYCEERRKLPAPNILTREQFMNPTCAQK